MQHSAAKLRADLPALNSEGVFPLPTSLKGENSSPLGNCCTRREQHWQWLPALDKASSLRSWYSCDSKEQDFLPFYTFAPLFHLVCRWSVFPPCLFYSEKLDSIMNWCPYRTFFKGFVFEIISLSMECRIPSSVMSTSNILVGRQCILRKQASFLLECDKQVPEIGFNFFFLFYSC